MRARFIAGCLLLVAASAASADNEFTVFLNGVGYTSSGSTSEWNGSGGVSFEHSWSPRWSTEASIGYEQRYRDHGVFLDNNAPAMARDRVTTYPMDLLMRFRFPNDTRWTPYISAGAHYVGAPNITDFSTGNGIFPGPITLVHFHDRFSGEIGGGTTFRITPHFGLQLDLKQQLRLRSEFFDPVARGSVGVNWKW